MNIYFVQKSTRKLMQAFLLGGALASIFAPIYFLPAIFILSYLANAIKFGSVGAKNAFSIGFAFGLGFFFFSLYWISFALLVFIEDFWWALPLAAFGIPAILALFPAGFAYILWHFKDNNFYHFIFASLWIVMEWLISWLFTGFPWAVIGYGFSVSDILLQSASLMGVLGLSFIAVFIGSIFYTRNGLIGRIMIAVLCVLSMAAYGYQRLHDNPTKYSHIKARIVQPSIPQDSKWDPYLFWQQLDKQIALSQKGGFMPDIIIWSEAALVVPLSYPELLPKLSAIFGHDNQILLTGGVTEIEAGTKIHSSMLAFDMNYAEEGTVFLYHKKHLVPFGEYIPLRDYLPLQKITPGLIDYSPGQYKGAQYIKNFNLSIYPLVCYEAIFFGEIETSNASSDLFINITNDAWYGESSGPAQHLEISRMRAIEHGLPLLRSANNGISAVIDPLGRVLQKMPINAVGVIDSFIPLKLGQPTTYSEIRNLSLLLVCALVLFLQILYNKFFGKL